MRLKLKKKIIPRTITKFKYKQAYSWFRENGGALNFCDDLRNLCECVKREDSANDPLLVKSFSLAVKIEQSQMLRAA